MIKLLASAYEYMHQRPKSLSNSQGHNDSLKEMNPLLCTLLSKDLKTTCTTVQHMKTPLHASMDQLSPLVTALVLSCFLTTLEITSNEGCLH